MEGANAYAIIHALLLLNYLKVFLVYIFVLLELDSNYIAEADGVLGSFGEGFSGVHPPRVGVE